MGVLVSSDEDSSAKVAGPTAFYHHRGTIQGGTRKWKTRKVGARAPDDDVGVVDLVLYSVLFVPVRTHRSVHACIEYTCLRL